MNDQADQSEMVNESARRRFEANRLAGRSDPIIEFLPNSEAPDYLPTLEELVHIEIEFGWKVHAAGQGERPASLEDHLKDFPDLGQPAILLRLVSQEFSCRQRAELATDTSSVLHTIQDTIHHPPRVEEQDESAVDHPNAGDSPADDPSTLPSHGNGVSIDAEDLTMDSGDSSPARPFVDQEEIPGYELQGELGRGGMGVVYRALEEKLKRVVALKILLAGPHADKEERVRFQREAEAVAQLQHPHIVQIHDIGEHRRRPYLSLEFLPGGSLSKQISGQPQSPRKSARLVETLARAIHFAHQQGIIHRDLKPGNVLLTSDGQPKITDFGLAKRLEGDSFATKIGSIMGTPNYMAPEQASDQTVPLSPAVDVYGLGAILYCLLTGRPPFVSSNPINTMRQVLELPPVPPRQLIPDLDRDLETICLKCLEKSPQRRYASAEELADELVRFLDGHPIHARPIGRIPRAWRWCRRKPMIASLTAAVIILVLSLAVGAPIVAVQQAALARAEYAQRVQALSDKKAAEDREQQVNNLVRIKEENARVARDQSELALETLQTVIFDIQDQLENVPRVGRLRRRLIGVALERLNQVADSYLEQDSTEESTAAALTRMADLYRQYGPDTSDEKTKPDAPTKTSSLVFAIKLYQRAREIAQARVKQAPNDSVRRRMLAFQLSQLSQALIARGGYRHGLATAEEAIEQAERAGAQQPQNGRIIGELTMAHTLKGFAEYKLLEQDRERKEAARSLLLAREVGEPWLAEHPGETRVTVALTIAYEYLSVINEINGNALEAEQFLKQRLQLLEQLQNQDDRRGSLTSLQIAERTALTRELLGNKARRAERHSEALDHYTRALPIIQQQAEDNPQDLARLDKLAKLLDNFGRLYVQWGKGPQAIEHYTRSREIYAERKDRDPQDAAMWRSYLNSTRQLADVHLQFANASDAGKLYEEAIRIGMEVLSTVETTDQHLFSLDISEAWLGLAKVVQNNGDPQQAVEPALKAVRASKKTYDDNPSRSRYHRFMYQASKLAGDLFLTLCQFPQAVEQYEIVVDVSGRRFLANPNLNNGIQVAERNLDLGSLNVRLLNLEKARGSFQQGIDALQQLANDNLLSPQADSIRVRLQARLEWCRAAESSAEDLEFALKQPAASLTGLLAFRCRVLVHKGMFPAAITTAEKLQPSQPPDLETAFESACVLALLASSLNQADPPVAEELKRRGEAFALSAVKQLAELASKKYFSNPDRAQKLKRIPDLDGLRNRTEFQSLLKSLATTSG